MPATLSALRGGPASRFPGKIAGPVRSVRTPTGGGMPQTPHIEKHFTAGNTVRDIVIGMSDGLTVPFALAAGLTGAITQSRLIITAGFAEIAAGSIAMGLGGYLAARGDAEHYLHEEAREYDEVKRIPEAEVKEIVDIFKTYGITEPDSSSIVQSLRQRPKDW